jgi:hypothetical protein
MAAATEASERAQWRDDQQRATKSEWIAGMTRRKFAERVRVRNSAAKIVS